MGEPIERVHEDEYPQDYDKLRPISLRWGVEE